MAIPDENFYNVSIGGKYADGATGKEFLGYQRGKWDWLGIDDGGRNHYPDNLFPIFKTIYDRSDPYAEHNKVTPDMIREQNKKIGDLSRIGTRRYTAYPGLNFSLSAGRVFDLSQERGTIGVVGALTYRNEQSIDRIEDYYRGKFYRQISDGIVANYDAETEQELDRNSGMHYKYNTTWSALLNAGWKKGNHAITTRNLYSRVFSNSFERYIGYGDLADNLDGGWRYGQGPLPMIREFDRPKFLDLFQNKLEGKHKLGGFTFDWMLAHSRIVNDELDAVDAYLLPAKFLYADGIKDLQGEPRYEFDDDYRIYTYKIFGYDAYKQQQFPSLQRSRYLYKERTLNAEAALSYQFDILKSRQIVKAGAQYLGKRGKFDWTQLPFAYYDDRAHGDITQPSKISIDYADPEKDGFYAPDFWDGQRYEGKNANAAYFGMMDNRIGRWARIVWGLRVESYQYTPIYEGAQYGSFKEEKEEKKESFLVNKETGTVVSGNTDAVKDELKWRYLPSVSLTLTPLSNLNIRGSYAKSVVRPGLIENSHFMRYNSVWGAYQVNKGMLSTQITHKDVKVEWYPRPGEIFSVGYFRKEFENPAEFYKRMEGSGSYKTYVYVQNSKSALVTGWEFEVRKNLEFLIDGESPILRNTYITANLTKQNSEVQAREFTNPTNEYSLGEDIDGNSYAYRDEILLDQKRPLYGQVPLLYNIGLQYSGNRLGMNVAYNFMDYKTYFTAEQPMDMEFEREREQLDAQFSYKFLKDKNMQVKFNLSNLLNTPYQFYENLGYERKETIDEKGKKRFEYPYKFGYDDRFQWGELKDNERNPKVKSRIGDVITYSKRTGISFSFSASYTF